MNKLTAERLVIQAKNFISTGRTDYTREGGTDTGGKAAAFLMQTLERVGHSIPEIHKFLLFLNLFELKAAKSLLYDALRFFAPNTLTGSYLREQHRKDYQGVLVINSAAS